MSLLPLFGLADHVYDFAVAHAAQDVLLLAYLYMHGRLTFDAVPRLTDGPRLTFGSFVKHRLTNRLAFGARIIKGNLSQAFKQVCHGLARLRSPLRVA